MDQSSKPGDSPLDLHHPRLESSSTSSDLISVPLRDSTVEVVEVSVHQGPVVVTSDILVMEQAPTMDIMVPVLTCMPAALMCAAPCTEYKCSRASALSRNASTIHIAGAGFPANPQCTNNVFRSVGYDAGHD